MALRSRLSEGEGYGPDQAVQRPFYNDGGSGNGTDRSRVAEDGRNFVGATIALTSKMPTAIQQDLEREVNSMPRQFDVVIEQDTEGYYVASVPALRGCHTQAKSLDDLMERIKEAIELCLEESEEDEEALNFVGVQRVVVDRGKAA